ncbi:MAG: hypothetical protein RJA99_174 [Pseudomonadota bacterium]|jgi:hypothetical protein
MAAVWDEVRHETGQRVDAAVPGDGSAPPAGPALFAVPPLGLADVDGRIERLLARLDAPDPFCVDDTPADDAPAGIDLNRRLEDCVALHRQQAQEVRDELAAQRADLRRWLHDGLAVLQARIDAEIPRDRAADPRIAATAQELAGCREDLDGVVTALRAVSVGQREQFEAMGRVSVAANLRLREDVEQVVREVRIDLERRLERIERAAARRIERQRRLAVAIGVGLGLAQIAGLAAAFALR